jgi:hypothetical protein
MKSTVAKIYEAIDSDFIRMMQNWARATAGIGIASYVSPAYDDSWAGYRHASMPLLQGEAADVSILLERIAPPLRRPVMVFWQFEGRPIARLARAVRIDPRTYVGRVIDGHAALQRALRAYREAIAQQARVNKQAMVHRYGA